MLQKIALGTGNRCSLSPCFAGAKRSPSVFVVAADPANVCVISVLDCGSLPAILKRFTGVTEFRERGAWSSEEAELLSPLGVLGVPLEFVVPACSESRSSITLLKLRFPWER